jgi:hypothetical protein
MDKKTLVSESFLMSYSTMCKKLNFVYMIDRMKCQYFDFFAISQKEKTHRRSSEAKKRENFPNIHRNVEREKVLWMEKFYNHALYQLFRNFPLVYLLLLLYRAVNEL